MLQMNGYTLQQVEKFKYIRVLLTSDGRRNREIETRIGKVNAVLRELYCSVVTNRELWNTAKLSVYKSVFVPILTYGCESWVMTVRILSQVQVVGMGFLQRVHGVTLRDNVRSCEMCNTLNVEPLLRIGRSHNCGGLAMFPECHKKDSGGGPADYTHGKVAQRLSRDQVEWLHLRPRLVSFRREASRRLLLTVDRDFCGPKGFSNFSRTAVPATFPRGKSGLRMNEWMNESFKLTILFLLLIISIVIFQEKTTKSKKTCIR